MAVDPVELTDAPLSLRPLQDGDVPVLVAGRDEGSRRWLGPGSANPSPTACIVVSDQVVGWVDYDHDLGHDWLDDYEVNLGYCVFAPHRGNGYAARAVELLLAQLRDGTEYRVASLLIDSGNAPSLGVARRCRFELVGALRGQMYFRRLLR